ncbi:MAG: low molecular weight protein-tyrosine-phosphatase, partial [Sediminibacterium sp.]
LAPICYLLSPIRHPSAIFVGMKVLMVCLGNICRSPLAEGILQQKAREAGLAWEVDSAGTGNYHIGEPPHQLSQKVALLNGIDIGQQRCRQFHPKDMDQFDLIYVMDHNNYQDVKRMSGERWNESKTRLILSEIDNSDDAVPDPWYGTEKDYHHVFALLSSACDHIILKYNQSNK